jgi:hypothetical protein
MASLFIEHTRAYFYVVNKYILAFYDILIIIALKLLFQVGRT